jgi:Xaa-Pro aminopeptidase
LTSASSASTSTSGSVSAGVPGERAERLASGLAELGADALLVDSLTDVRYLTGFTGSNGLVLLFGDAVRQQLGRHRFLTDFRYEVQSAEQVGEAFEREIVKGELLDAVGGLLSEARGRLGFDERRVSVKSHRRLTELLEGWELVACDGAVEELRAVKDAGELTRIRSACELADEALKATLEDGLVGRSEQQVAIELELQMRRLGAEAASFPAIVAAGPRGALPHATPTGEPIPADVLVTIDWGARLDGYCSDCTRTFATGEGLSQLARDTYALVLESQRLGLQAAVAGRSGREVDAVARDVIERGGQGEHFGHGLGHGVGMEVHEGPRLSRIASEKPLQAGNVVTIEPGVYLPGELGVRIEDLIVVGEDSQEVLTSLPKELTVIS